MKSLVLFANYDSNEFHEDVEFSKDKEVLEKFVSKFLWYEAIYTLRHSRDVQPPT